MCIRDSPPLAVARLLTQELPGTVVPSGAPLFEPTVETLDELLGTLARGQFSKEGTPKVLDQLAAGAPSVAEAVVRSGLAAADSGELARVVDRIVQEQIGLVRERREAAFSPLMGDVMRELRGRRDGREVADELRRAIAKVLADGPH